MIIFQMIDKLILLQILSFHYRKAGQVRFVRTGECFGAIALQDSNKQKKNDTCFRVEIKLSARRTKMSDQRHRNSYI